MDNYIYRFLLWLKGIFGFKPLIKTIVCEELPDRLSSNTLYLVGEPNNYWQAAIICPCGCDDLIQLAIDPTGRPRWRVRFDKNGLASLHPSIQRAVGCRSHFFLRNGKIVWCKDD